MTIGKHAKWLMCLPMFVLFVGCGHEEKAYKEKLDVKTTKTPALSFDRYEEVLFHLDTARFKEELISVQQDYLPFLEGDLSDPSAVQYLKDFATDTFSIMLYHKVMQHYPDINEIRRLSESVYSHFQYYYPDAPLPCHFYTCVSGVHPDIPPVMLVGDAVVISLDWYLDKDDIYDRIGMPQYRSERTSLLNLACDLGLLLYDHFVADDHVQTTVLEEMVHEGRRLFFAEALCPSLPDEILLGYSKEQLAWANANEGGLWADIVGNQRLYSTEFEMFRTFFADGPFTHEYSYDAPSRLGVFLGLQIVRSYMGNNEVSVQELMCEHDLQAIFQASGYKPKK